MYNEIELPNWKTKTAPFNLKPDLLDVEAAHIAANSGKPHVYTIPGYDNVPFSFLVIGCPGSGKPSQLEAALLLNQVARISNPRPLFILFPGDMLYDDGAKTPYDEIFKNYFYDMYTGERFDAIDPLPAFIALGNHDENRHRKAFLSHNPIGRETGVQLIAHGFLPSGKYLTVADKVKLYRTDSLNLKTLPKWNLPHFFYSLIIGNTQIFMLNSNTYAKDYLESLTLEKNEYNLNYNQALWFKKEYDEAKSAGRKIITVAHHPLKTCGKRAHARDYDTDLYLSLTEVHALNKVLGCKTNSYNELLCKIREVQQTPSDLELVAHDHTQSYYNNHLNLNETFKICQLTAGGGGQDLQNRESFLTHPFVSCYLKQNGCSTITVDPAKADLQIDIYSTSGHHLTFSSAHHYPLTYPCNDPLLESFKNKILMLCDIQLETLRNAEIKERDAQKKSQIPTYIQSGFNLFSKLTNAIYGDNARQKEIFWLHDIWAFINQPKLPDLISCIQYTREVMSNLPHKDANNSFHALLADNLMNDEYLFKKFGIHLNLTPTLQAS